MIVNDARLSITLSAACAGELSEKAQATLDLMVKTGKLAPLTVGGRLTAWEGTVSGINMSHTAILDFENCTVTADDGSPVLSGTRNGEDWEGAALGPMVPRFVMLVTEPADPEAPGNELVVSFDGMPVVKLSCQGGVLVFGGGDVSLPSDMWSCVVSGDFTPLTTVRFLVIGEILD